MGKTVTRQVKRRYPLTLSDLTKSELKSLTTILTLENPRVYQIVRPNMPSRVNEGVKDAIKGDLPCALRRNKILQIMPNYAIGRPARLCPSHGGLNPYVIADTCDLTRAEVTERLDRMDRYAEEIHPLDRKLLRSIQVLGKIWGERTAAKIDTDTESFTGGVLPYFQSNECEACMLGQVATEPLFLRNIRITLLSRTRTKKKHRAPRLLRFIDVCIERHDGHALRVFHESNQLSIEFKLARKATVAARRKRKDRHSERGRKEESTKSITVYLDPELRRQHLEQHNTLRSENAVSSRKHKASDRDTLADEIIPLYEHMSPSEPQRAPHVKPLSFKKKRSSGSSSRSKTLAGSVPSRERLDWQKVMEHKKSPLASLTTKFEAIDLEGPEMDGGHDAGALAAEYRDLISPREAYDSESEYSQPLSENDPVEPSLHGTTWSLLMEDASTLLGNRARH